MTYWIGIDVGTGGTRVLLIDAQCKIAASFTAPHEDIHMDRPLWAEQRPQNWWDAAQEAIRGALAQVSASGRDVRGVGLSGQMHGLVMLDAHDKVIRPALIWCDQRSQPQVDAINELIGKDAVLSYTANPVLTGFTLPKLLWVRDNERAHFERVRKILLPKDYVRFGLTGEHATDVADASGTSLFDVAHRAWSVEMAERVGLPQSVLPHVFESSHISGRISSSAAAATGLAQGTPVVAGAGDQAASGVGNGIVEPGIVSCTLGTSGVVFAYTEHPEYDTQGRIHTFCHAVQDAWHVMGVTQGAGLSLQWFRNNLEPAAGYEALTLEAATAAAGADGLFWLPYLMGERTPHLDPAARGGWIGLTAKHTRADLIRSLMEGVSYSQKDCLDVIQQMGVHVESVRLSGGGARSLFWQQMIADVFGKRVAVLENQEGSAYGAALLAMVGTGEYSSVREVTKAAIREVRVCEPRVEEGEIYRAGFRVYRALYPATKGALWVEHVPNTS
jgi:xylulokinase